MIPTDVKKPEDLSRINLSEPTEMNFWVRHLNASKEEIEKATKAVGISADAVRKFLYRSS